jgi:hypothetical protein
MAITEETIVIGIKADNENANKKIEETKAKLKS